MSYVLDNVATTDTYPGDGAGASLLGDGIVRLVITVSTVNAPVYYQLARGRGNWAEEKRLAGGAVYTLERDCDGIRFRNARSGVTALVTVEAATQYDLPDDG